MHLTNALELHHLFPFMLVFLVKRALTILNLFHYIKLCCNSTHHRGEINCRKQKSVSTQLHKEFTVGHVLSMS